MRVFIIFNSGFYSASYSKHDLFMILSDLNPKSKMIYEYHIMHIINWCLSKPSWKINYMFRYVHVNEYLGFLLETKASCILARVKQGVTQYDLQVW